MGTEKLFKFEVFEVVSISKPKYYRSEFTVIIQGSLRDLELEVTKEDLEYFLRSKNPGDLFGKYVTVCTDLKKGTKELVYVSDMLGNAVQGAHEEAKSMELQEDQFELEVI